MNWYWVNVKTAKGYLNSWEEGDSMAEVIENMRLLHGRGVSVAVRKIFYGEWDCGSFTIAGHVPHEGNRFLNV